MDEKAQKILAEVIEREKQERGTDSLLLTSQEDPLAGKIENLLDKYSGIEAEDLLRLLSSALDEAE